MREIERVWKVNEGMETLHPFIYLPLERDESEGLEREVEVSEEMEKEVKVSEG